MQEIIEIATYQKYKATLDAEIQKEAEGFVKIGYLLKLAKDTDILSESGYENVVEFAKAEYGLDKSQVSRFININERFCDPEHPERLQEKYQGFGSSKLSMMLQLPDIINEELSPSFTKSEIKTIQEEVKAEEKVSDLEVIAEGKKADSIVQQVIWIIGKENPELYVRMVEAELDGEWSKAIKRVAETMSPAGEAIYTVRIQGVGKIMLSVKGEAINPTLTNIRENTKQEITWEDILEAIVQNCDAKLSAKESWEVIYGEKFPEQEKQKVAPVQQVAPPAGVKKKEEPKKEPKKQSKVIVEKPKPVQEVAEVEEEIIEKTEEVEEQLAADIKEGNADEREKESETEETDSEERTDYQEDYEAGREEAEERNAEVHVSEKQKLRDEAYDLSDALFTVFALEKNTEQTMQELQTAKEDAEHLLASIERMIELKITEEMENS